jgi:hypothetical protein
MNVKDKANKSAFDLVRESSSFSPKQNIQILKEAAWAKRFSMVWLRHRYRLDELAAPEAAAALDPYPCKIN